MSDELANSRPAVILLVEDNDNDVVLMQQGFKRARLAVDLRIAGDGEECMAFLRKEGRYAGSPTPDLILLDLNMPRMDGREVMLEISRDEHLRHLPVVILTTSADEREILEMYDLRCSSCIVKPVDLEKFLRVIRSITDYWFTIVVLPTRLDGVEQAKNS